MNRSGPTWTNWNDRLELLFYFFPAQALMSFRPHISFHRLQERMESRRETVSPPRAKCSCTQLNGRRVHGNFSRLSANASQTIRRHLNRPHLAPKVTATTTTTTDRPKISFIDCNFFFFFQNRRKKKWIPRDRSKLIIRFGDLQFHGNWWRIKYRSNLCESRSDRWVSPANHLEREKKRKPTNTSNDWSMFENGCQGRPSQ